MEDYPEHIRLVEQAYRLVALEPGDVRYVAALGFKVAFEEIKAADETTELVTCLVNPGASVGHFQLPSHRIVVIEPKIDNASVLRMLAYVFTANHRHLLRDEQVNYATDKPLFEPLVEIFNGLVNARARRGLVQDYIRREENLGVFRGALNINSHVQHNIGRENRIHCRFFEQTVDIPDNRLVKTTLHHLLQFGGWTSRTTQSLITNFHQFDSVTLQRFRPQTESIRHYHRLNEDYRPIHELCRLFLACSSVSERVGVFGFRGFLLDMNLLFEQFVEKAFQSALRRNRLLIEAQKERPLSQGSGTPSVIPDITVRRGGEVVIIADAKYKRDESGPQNSDIYQVIAYGTVLQCSHVYLLYPKTEIESERDIAVLNSPIVVKTRRVDISSPQAVEAAESLARDLIFRENIASVESVFC